MRSREDNAIFTSVPIEDIEFYKQTNEELQQENKQLKEQLDKYENPEDMTLMYMWCTEKVKDENKQLKDNWNELKKCVIDLFNNSQDITYLDVLSKMQELEESDSSE